MESQVKRGENGESNKALAFPALDPLTADLVSASVGASEPQNGTAKANGSAKPNGTAKANGAPRLRTYEELDGAEGRAVFFRPHRYAAADFAPLHGSVRVSLGDASYESPVRDVSQNGVAFGLPEGVPVRLRQRLHIVLRFDAHEAFRGDVRVGSVRKQDGGTVVGVSFADFLLDIDELLQLKTVRNWKPPDASPRVAEKPWHVHGCDRFKAAVAELRLFLEDAQQQLAHLEAELPWNVLHGNDNPARAALVARLRRDFVADTVSLSEEIDSAVREAPEGHKNASAKEWSLRYVHGLLMQAPCCHRARYKPFGYPGDYEVMNFIYERNFEGANLFARAVGLAFTNTRAALAVRCRKDLVKRYLKALLARRGCAGQPMRVLSIAGGPAQELTELFQEIEDLPAPLEVVVLEQDKNALAHAWRRLRSSSDARFPGAVRLTFLHESIKRILRDEGLFGQFEPFDFIYSCGLYDYLQRRTAIVLTRRLSAATKPGGQLLVANMVDHPTRWLMEHHLDWPLIYRSRDELLEIGAAAVPHAHLRILEEESGANPFLEVIRE